MDRKTQFYRYFGSALFFFSISALYGWILRLYKVKFIEFIPFNHFLQAHSHVTFLGWGFIAVVSLVIYLTNPEWIMERNLKLRFRAMQISLLGLLISFPLQGYRYFSIGLLTIFLLVSYSLLYSLYKRFSGKKALHALFFKTGILYYYLSSLAIWVIPVIKIKTGKSILYNEAVGFYLHFLYNGFFTLTLFGLMCLYIEKVSNDFQERKDQVWFYRILSFTVIPTYFLISYTLRGQESDIFFYISFAGGLIQLSIIFFGIKFLIEFLKLKSGYMLKPLLMGFVISIILKTVLQFLASIPSINEIAYKYSSLLFIGYIHLYTLGFMSISILWLFYNFFRFKQSFFGMLNFFIGVILSEFLLFLQGGLYFFGVDPIPHFDVILLGVSTLMPFGIMLLWISHFRNLRNMK